MVFEISCDLLLESSHDFDEVLMLLIDEHFSFLILDFKFGSFINC